MSLPSSSSFASSASQQPTPTTTAAAGSRSLATLPNELIAMISEHLTTTKDKNAFAQTSRRLHGPANDALYRFDARPWHGVGGAVRLAAADAREDGGRRGPTSTDPRFAIDTHFPCAFCGAGNLEVIRLLALGYGADGVVSGDKADGVTALHAAALKGRVDIVEFLFRHKVGGDVNAADRDGNTPLHYACRLYDNSAAVDALLSSGADIDVPNSGQYTAFMCACLFGCLGTAAALLHAAPRRATTFPLALHPWFEGPLHCLCCSMRDFFPRLATAPVTVSQWEADRRWLIVRLLTRGADINAAALSDCPPLILASRSNDNPASFLKFLITSVPTQPAVGFNGVVYGYDTSLRHAVLDAFWDLQLPCPAPPASMGVVGAMLEYAASRCSPAHLRDIIREVQVPGFWPPNDVSNQLLQMLTDCAASMNGGAGL